MITQQYYGFREDTLARSYFMKTSESLQGVIGKYDASEVGVFEVFGAPLDHEPTWQ